MMFDTTSSAMPQIKAGKFRPLAVTGPARSPELPNVPTIAEVGYPAAEMTTWYGLFVTGGTPPAIVDQLHAELERALALPDVQARLKGLGGEPGGLTIEEAACVLDVSPSTAKSEWRTAKAWLGRELGLDSRP